MQEPQLIAALRYACREAGTGDFSRDPATAQAMWGLRRERPQKPAQLTGLTCEVIVKIEATACAPRKGRGRGRCMESAAAAVLRGHVAYLTPDTAACLGRIKPADARPKDRIFAMSVRTTANRVKVAAEAAGMDGSFAGHSGRVGCAGPGRPRAGLTELQVAGRWQFAAMPALYVRKQMAGRGAAAKYLM